MPIRKAFACGISVVALGWLAFMVLYFHSGLAAGKLQDTAAFILGVGLLGLMPALVMIAAAVAIVALGRHEAQLDCDARLQDRLLESVATRGQCTFEVLARENGVTVPQVVKAIEALVGLGLFTGYVNWQKQQVTALEAAALAEERCPSCGALLELAGRGVARCAYCGTTAYLAAEGAPGPPPTTGSGGSDEEGGRASG